MSDHLHSYRYKPHSHRTNFIFFTVHLLPRLKQRNIHTNIYMYITDHQNNTTQIDFLPFFLVLLSSEQASAVRRKDELARDPGRLRPVFRYERTSSRIHRLYREPGNFDRTYRCTGISSLYEILIHLTII